MASQPSFPELAQKFQEITSEYNGFEKDFIARVTNLNIDQSATQHTIISWKRQKKKEMNDDINQFTAYLQLFSNLHKKMFILASDSDPKGIRKQYLEGISVVINSIQYIYLTRLSQNINDRNNVTNFKWAVFSILLGILSTVISLFAPYYLPNTTEDKMNKLEKKIDRLNNKIEESKKVKKLKL